MLSRKDRDLKWMNEIIEAVGKIDEIPENEILRRERLMNIIIIGWAILLFISGVELLVPLAMILPFNRASKVMFRGKMSYSERWAKLFIVTMKYVFLVMIFIFVSERIYPPILNIHGFKLS